MLLVTVLTDGRAPDRDSHVALLERARQRLQAVPGVEAATYVRRIPGPFFAATRPVSGDGGAASVSGLVRHVGPDYLSALGLAAVEGREFAGDDRSGTAVVSRSLAAALWPGDSAIGRRLSITSEDNGRTRTDDATVIGVAPEALFDGPSRDSQTRFLFLTEHQNPDAGGGLGQPGSVASICPTALMESHPMTMYIPAFNQRGARM
jgi:hypothetical protein